MSDNVVELKPKKGFPARILKGEDLELAEETWRKSIVEENGRRYISLDMDLLKDAVYTVKKQAAALEAIANSKDHSEAKRIAIQGMGDE